MRSRGKLIRACTTCRAIFRGSMALCPGDGGPVVEMATDPLLGQVLGDRYLLESYLSEGGMGVVYKARHFRTGRPFAVKTLFGELTVDPSTRARFAREAGAASAIHHPNVVPVLDYGESPEGLPYLAMEYVAGETLHTVLRRGPISLFRAVTLARQICQGLAHAHEHGLVHRDLKPANVMLEDQDGQEVARILDFGLAFFRLDLDTRITTAGLCLGTPEYMAPEQLRGETDIDGRADLFALGVTLHRMIRRRPLFEGSTIQVAGAVLRAPRPRLSDGRVVGAPVPEALEELVAGLLEPDRERRPRSAKRVGEQLAQIRQLIDDVETDEHRTHEIGVLELSDLSVDEGGTSAGAATRRSTPAALGPSSDSEPAAGEQHGVAVESRSRTTRVRRARREWWLGSVIAATVLFAAAGAAWFGGHERSSRTTVAPAPPAPRVVPGAAARVVSPPAPAGPAAPVGSTVTNVRPGSAPAGRRPNGARDSRSTRAEPLPVELAAAVPANRAPVAPADPPAERPAEATPEVVDPDATQEGTAPASAPAPTPAAPAPVEAVAEPAQDADDSLEEFTRLYREVAASLNHLAQDRGDAAAAPLRRRFFAVPYSEALRAPALRRSGTQALRALGHDIQAALL